MPVPANLSHRNLQETNLAYISNASPTLTDAHFVSGSGDILTSIRGYFERRPGFANSLEASPTAFTSVQRIFTWNRWDGTFIYMVNDISGGNSVVYKMISGTDANFVSLFTDTGNTGIFDFVVSNNAVYFANGHVAKKWDPTNGVSNWGITAPATVSTIGNNAGAALSLQVGWKYVYCYYNKNSGHISSPSPVSASTGTETVNSVTATVTASTDPQVTNIRVFRTTDGGGGNYFEVLPSGTASSSGGNDGTYFNNTTGTITDSTPDASLSTVTAPTTTFNDPPPAWAGMVYWHGRIWGFVNNKVWFTGLEELVIGVPEESVPSGIAGNFWQFDQQVLGLSSLPDVLLVFCPGRVYEITGDTLDTQRRTSLSNKRGTRQRASIASLGSMTSWFDTSNQIWGSDGNQLQEPGQDIRPDLSTLNFSNVSATFHVSGVNHWYVFSSGTQLLVYDLDTDQWMPPWNVACQIIHSGEISAGNYVLLASIGNKIYKLSTASFNDAGSAYSWTGITNLFNLVPDFGRRFNYIAQGIYDQPSRLGVAWYVGIERNTNVLASCQILVDDDPTVNSASFKDISQNQLTPEEAFLRTQGQNLIQDAFGCGTPAGRRMSVKLTGQSADQQDKIYSAFIAYGERR